MVQVLPARQLALFIPVRLRSTLPKPLRLSLVMVRLIPSHPTWFLFLILFPVIAAAIAVVAAEVMLSLVPVSIMVLGRLVTAPFKFAAF